ncbi:hypothetical protein [Devosia alba]|uniref:hypothetical protein n=1 Tax=Devosia alba TaxID=3152360 RepID=UPI003267880E
MNFIIQIIVGVVLSIASSLLQQAFAPKPQEQKRRTGTRGSAQIGGKVPQYFLVGTVGEPGKLEYQNAWGNDGEVPNAYLTGVYSFGDLPITGLAGLFVNGVRVTVSATDAVTQGYPVPQYSGHLWWKFFDGTQTTADSYLTGKFGSDADRPWTGDMVGRGVPYLVTTALWSETLWTGLPSFMGEFQGIKLYDPRQDSTAGGSGSQRWANPSTWAFSDNNWVIIYNIERGIYYNEPGATTLGTKIWGGSATQAQMPYAAWAAAMDKCDLAISLVGGGTEKQFRAGRRISLNERPADVVKELLIGANSRICHSSDGTIYPLCGVPDEADGAFSDADVLATEPLGSIPFPNLDSIINGATATYREPSQAWEDKETAPYYRSDLEAEDDGRRQVEGLDLGTTFSGTQAQRVIKAVIEEGRRFKTHVVALPPEYAQFRVLQALAWTSDRFDYSAKMFLITARTVTPWGVVVLGLQEIDPADHNWTPGTDEQPLSFAPVVTNRPAPQEVSGFYVEPATAMDNEGNGRRPAFDVFWSSASVGVDVRAVRITMWLNDAIDPVADDPIVGDLAWQGDVPPPLGSARLTEAVTANTYFVIQIQYISESGRATVASDLFAVRARNIKLGADDIDITFADIAAEIIEKINAISIDARDAADRIEHLGTLLSEQDAANFNDQQGMKRELRKKVGDLEAGFIEFIEVALGPGGAIATSLSTLYAAMGGDSAQVLVRYEAIAAPAGVSARWAVQLSSDGDLFASAGIYLDLLPGGESRIVLDATQTVISKDGGATVLALFDENGLMIRDITAAMITSADGYTFLDLTNNEWQFASAP